MGQRVVMECLVPYCEQDATTRLGYCQPHGRMPFHVGLVLHSRVRANSRETVSRMIAEVDLKRQLVRFEGEKAWTCPKRLCLQTAPTPKEWLDLEQTPEWKAGNHRLVPKRQGGGEG